jgi:predicted nuclease with TOPRIM domain
MDIYAALEERVEKLINAYKDAQGRLVALEQENTRLRETGTASDALSTRVTELEGERDEVRARLEKLLATISGLQL